MNATDPAHVPDPLGDEYRTRVDTLTRLAVLRGSEALSSLSPSDPQTAEWLAKRGHDDEYGVQVAVQILAHYAGEIEACGRHYARALRGAA